MLQAGIVPPPIIQQSIRIGLCGNITHDDFTCESLETYGVYRNNYLQYGYGVFCPVHYNPYNITIRICQISWNKLCGVMHVFLVVTEYVPKRMNCHCSSKFNQPKCPHLKPVIQVC